MTAPLNAAEALRSLPEGEYRLALSRMADYMRCCIVDPDLSDREVEAARRALRDLEQRLN